ncbi:sugar phosphate isomerase/epimerase [Streptomyces sp. A7024]|uniref:Sugar phosphate isomerase/epimerase n=1 Tax=Streptomyces coryli TaxID=1128680 RepID=A0A6G4U6C5_9ACTN|nr:sugar phosphate isomerase/epimerase [Streptomyces coryli]NGN67653.1 sugar phosphate isomerase/epimerase [Streptomyces coryli]
MSDNSELARRLKRRSFLGVAAGATAAAITGAAASPAVAGGHGHGSRRIVPRGKLGIQLYTVRDQIASVGFAKVFQELEKAGYDQIEYAGYTQGTGAITLPQLRRLARDHDLFPIGSHVSHTGAYSFAESLEQVLDDAEALGMPYIGTWAGPNNRYGTTVDAIKRSCAEFNEYGAAAKARGMKWYTHNHSEEFGFCSDNPNVRIYDLMLAETDPDLVHLEMDIYWAYVGQYRFSKRPDGTPAPFEPLDYVLDDPRRYPLFHVKDGEHDEAQTHGYHMTDVGDGDIDYRRFIGTVTRRRGGDRYHNWLVERDDAVDPVTNPAGSFSTARRSAAYLTGRRKGE